MFNEKFQKFAIFHTEILRKNLKLHSLCLILKHFVLVNFINHEPPILLKSDVSTLNEKKQVSIAWRGHLILKLRPVGWWC